MKLVGTGRTTMVSSRKRNGEIHVWDAECLTCEWKKLYKLEFFPLAYETAVSAAVSHNC